MRRAASADAAQDRVAAVVRAGDLVGGPAFEQRAQTAGRFAAEFDVSELAGDEIRIAGNGEADGGRAGSEEGRLCRRERGVGAEHRRASAGEAGDDIAQAGMGGDRHPHVGGGIRWGRVQRAVDVVRVGQTRVEDDPVLRRAGAHQAGEGGDQRRGVDADGAAGAEGIDDRRRVGAAGEVEDGGVAVAADHRLFDPAVDAVAGGDRRQLHRVVADGGVAFDDDAQDVAAGHHRLQAGIAVEGAVGVDRRVEDDGQGSPEEEALLFPLRERFVADQAVERSLLWKS